MNEAPFIWPWAPVLKRLNNDEVTINWALIWKAIWYGKRICSLWLVGVNPGQKFIEHIIVHMPREQLFVLKVSYVSSNVVLWLSKADYYLFFCIFSDILIINNLI